MTSDGEAIDGVIRFLSCPVCRSTLRRDGSALRCENAHAFDIARQGHVSLFGGGRRANTGDTADMVAARERFLGRGHYAPIADAVGETITDVLPVDDRGLIADLAGGTGYYLARVLGEDRRSPAVSIDLSAAAARRAARAHPSIAAIVSDVWGELPLADSSCAVVLSIFGPRNGPEIRRVLRPDGALIVVSPTADHLRELVHLLGLIRVDPHKQERLERRLVGLSRRGSRRIRYRIDMSPDDIADEVRMGPSAYHVDSARVAAGSEQTTVTVSVDVSIWTPTQQHPPGVADESHNGSR